MIAAGEGRRLRPLTAHWPKPILPVDGKPVIVTLLQELEAAGIGRVTVVVGHLGGQIRRLLAGLDVRFAEQPEPLGSADAVRKAIDAGAAAPFVVSPADTVYSPGAVGRFLDHWRASGTPSALAPPLWGIGSDVLALLDDLPGPPFELLEAFRRAGVQGGGFELGPTRNLTDPTDLVRHNFVYLEQRPR